MIPIAIIFKNENAGNILMLSYFIFFFNLLILANLLIFQNFPNHFFGMTSYYDVE